jgi:hypothetical protein
LKQSARLEIVEGIVGAERTTAAKKERELAERLDEFWQRPDPALAAAGVEGEWLVARVRLFAVTLLLITQTYKLLQYPQIPVFVWGFWVTFGAALAALGIWLALRRRFWRPWLGFASSTLDVSLVTFALVTFVFVGSPLVALNSKVTFEIYFLAIIARSLRYDERICIGVGLLAVLQEHQRHLRSRGGRPRARRGRGATGARHASDRHDRALRRRRIRCAVSANGTCCRSGAS